MFNQNLFFVLTAVSLTFCLAVSLSDNKDPLVWTGRGTMIHLFEWKWTDIAAECERFLGPVGYAGVQVSPPNEHAVIEPYKPWYQRYQPVSYKLESRSGSEIEFKDMVSRCNKVGVRIYVDVVFNHMSGWNGNYGYNGSWFDSSYRQYPAVPYSGLDFNDYNCANPNGGIQNWDDPHETRNCHLSGLPDLNQGNSYVRGKILEFLNKLIDIGVAGFRIDAAKHMWPSHLNDIYSSLKNVRSDLFGTNKRPYIYQEMIDYSGSGSIKATDYTYLGAVTEFRYGQKLSEVVWKSDNQRLAYLKNFGEGWGFLNGRDAVAFIDNHDNQRSGGVLTFRQSREYKIANAFMLAWPYAFTQIISSYYFNDFAQGPPNNNGTTKNVELSGMICTNGWVCEHRWREIYNMAKFRNIVGFAPVNDWWDNGWHQIAFSRGDKGFIAINNEQFDLTLRNFQTGLPSGTYCDIINGDKDTYNNKCTGSSVTVDSSRKINYLSISDWLGSPIFATTINHRLN